MEGLPSRDGGRSAETGGGVDPVQGRAMPLKSGEFPALRAAAPSEYRGFLLSFWRKKKVGKDDLSEAK